MFFPQKRKPGIEVRPEGISGRRRALSIYPGLGLRSLAGVTSFRVAVFSPRRDLPRGFEKKRNSRPAGLDSWGAGLELAENKDGIARGNSPRRETLKFFGLLFETRKNPDTLLMIQFETGLTD